MQSHSSKEQDKSSKASAESAKSNQQSPQLSFQDNRAEVKQLKEMQEMADQSPQAKEAANLQAIANGGAHNQQAAQLHSIANSNNAPAQLMGNLEEEEPLQGKFSTIQRKENNTGLPNNLKSGVESLSGHSMDDVKVHYNSSKPAQLQAHAYAQGTDIHLGPGQEQHLPHEAWHVVQQKQGRVQPTKQLKSKVNINDDAGLEKEADVMGAKALQMKHKTTDNRGSTSLDNSNAPIQRLSINENPIDLSGVTSITRSGAGADGVYFFKDGTNTVVIKPDFESSAAEIMHRLMGEVGIGVPSLRAVKFKSSEGRSITNKLLEFKNTFDLAKQTALDNNITAEKPYSIMEFITGDDFTQMDDNSLAQVMSSDNILRDLGKIMAVDFISGNGDRFYEKVNMGNFMMKNGGLHAIDNTTRFDLSKGNDRLRRDGSTQKENAREGLIDIITNPQQRVGPIKMFLNKVKQDLDRKEGGTTQSTAINDNNVVAKMGEGIDAALAQLQISLHKKSLNDSLDLSDIRSNSGSKSKKGDVKEGIKSTARMLDVALMTEKKKGVITGNSHLREHDPETGKMSWIGKKMKKGHEIVYDSTQTVNAKKDTWYKAYDSSQRLYGLIRSSKVTAAT